MVLPAPLVNQTAGHGTHEQGGDGERAHDQTDLRVCAVEFLNHEDRQDGKEQEHAAGKQKGPQTQQDKVSGEQDLLAL